MQFRKKSGKDKGISKQNWNAYVEQSKGLERDYLAEILRSRKYALIIAFCCFLFAVSAVLWHQFNPVTVTEPFVLRVDNATGNVDAVSFVDVETKSYGEVVDNYFLAKFVRSYESYNYQNIQNDYDTTLLMSSQEVAEQYRTIYDNTGGKKARDTQLGQFGTRSVKILSITPDTKNSIASVRFTTTINSTNSTNSEHWIATITYQYVKANIDSNVRLVNPLGFVVTSYRVDKENM